MSRSDGIDPVDALSLRATAVEDVPVFFHQQLDADANYMAAFTWKDSTDRDTFTARWTRILEDKTIIKMTILADGNVAGHVVRFERSGTPEVTYWIGKEFWGKGVATRALSMFLERVRSRPLYARVAKDNVASIRVLEKCGFTVCGEDRGFANARGAEIEEFVLSIGPPVGMEPKS